MQLLILRWRMPLTEINFLTVIKKYLFKNRLEVIDPQNPGPIPHRGDFLFFMHLLFLLNLQWYSQALSINEEVFLSVHD